MFLRIVYVYSIFKHSRQKPKPFGFEIRSDNCGSVNSYLYDPFLPHLDWTQWRNDEPRPFITPKESKTDGVMMGWGKNRLKLA